MLSKSNTVAQNGTAPIQVLAYPRLTHRLLLNDHKVALGAAGLEAGSSVETYMSSTKRWIRTRWDTPRRIESAGDILLFRVAGVTHMANWDDHVPFLIDQVPSSPFSDSSSPLAKRWRL